MERYARRIGACALAAEVKKMPKSFNKCVSGGGRVRTKTVPGKGYIRICFKGGKGEYVIRYNRIHSDLDHMFNDSMGEVHNFGYDGFPNRDSDFVVLEDDGIRQVISGLANKWFVSSSDPGEGFSYGYDGEFGGIDTGCDGNGNVSLRCVGQ